MNEDDFKILTRSQKRKLNEKNDEINDSNDNNDNNIITRSNKKYKRDNVKSIDLDGYNSDSDSDFDINDLLESDSDNDSEDTDNFIIEKSNENVIDNVIDNDDIADLLTKRIIFNLLSNGVINDDDFQYEDEYYELDDNVSNDNVSNDNISNDDSKKELKEDDRLNNILKRLPKHYSKYLSKLDDNEKKMILLEEEKLQNVINTDKPLRYKIIKTNLSIESKSMILNKLEQFDNMTPRDNEYHKMRKYIDGILRIPFNNFVDMPINSKSKKKDINNFIIEAYQHLDKSIYGQDKAKNKFIQIIAQWISNPNSIGNVIGLYGPPGVGKTSLLREGVAKALKRPFNFMPLGGATDASYLEGHGYTYEGATWGKIIDMVMVSNCMNPIIFFDELDKVSFTDKGREIIGILMHLTDPSQNTSIQDRYFSGIDFDLSKALIIFSYNDPNLIDPILRDRIVEIKMKGFDTEQKINILNDFSIPKICKNIGFNRDNLIINDEILKYIITKYTTEKGVRSANKCLESIILKLNLLNLTTKEMNYSIKDFKLPIELTNDIVDKFLTGNKKDDDRSISAKMMYM
jgi:ATP-dependent Lon protease